MDIGILKLFSFWLVLPNSANSNHHLSHVCACTTLYSTEFLVHMLCMWHIYVHTLTRYAHPLLVMYGIYAQFVGIFVCGTYFAITYELQVTFGCVFDMYIQTWWVDMHI